MRQRQFEETQVWGTERDVLRLHCDLLLWANIMRIIAWSKCVFRGVYLLPCGVCLRRRKPRSSKNKCADLVDGFFPALSFIVDCCVFCYRTRMCGGWSFMLRGCSFCLPFTTKMGMCIPRRKAHVRGTLRDYLYVKRVKVNN